MEEHSKHWEHSLLGWGFWQDAKQYETKMGHDLEAAVDQNLPRRFPFNLGPDQTPSSRRRRRLSMTDAEKVGIQHHSPLSTGVSWLRDFERRARSPSPRKILGASRELWKRRGSPPLTPSSLHPERCPPLKPPDLPPSVIVQTREVSPSPPRPIDRQPAPPVDDFATAGNPFVGFCGGSTLLDLHRAKKSLGLDLSRPCEDEVDEEPVYLSVNELKPLCEFRSLQSLRLTGMSQSYQYYIWQAAWLNLNLENLWLEMALEPEIDSAVHAAKWKPIKEGWEMDKKHDSEPVYYGNLGDGQLHPDIGCGEYLDKYSIEKAKVLAMAEGQTSPYLSIKHLTLSGFVVDADPFLHWFNPQKLQSIKFRGQCLDAGLWLPQSMEKVIILCPRKIELEPVAVGMVSVDLRKDLKMAGISGESNAHQNTYLGSLHLF